MKLKLLSTWLCLCFFTILTAQKASPSRTIQLTQDNGRYPVELQEGSEKLMVCGLEEGKTYSFAVTGLQTACAYELETTTTFEKHGNKITTITKQSCLELNINTTCKPLPTGTMLSIHCVDCHKEEQAKSAASIQVSSNSDANYLIQDIFIGGNCFDVSGVVRRGNASQTGTFSAGSSSIGIEEGIILSTGLVNDAEGPNNATSTSYDHFNGFTDPDLLDISNGAEINDVASIEFSFTPTIATVSFQYAFASEEYCEYALSQFNDVFGFFISGPGINGPFSNNAENIAQLPGGSGEVSIQNVNHVNNTAFYLDNIPAGVSTSCNSSGGVAENDIEYDGFTTVLTATANVIPCQTYRIKLVVADVADGLYDSAVFLKANSFNAGITAEAELSLTGASAGPTQPYEGCSDAFFTFTRADGSDINEPLVVPFSISSESTATAGLDYATLPSAVIIPAGQESVNLFVDIFEDFIFEGTENIILELDTPCSCSAEETTINITDPPPLNVVMDNVVVCDGEEVLLTPQVSGGVPGYTYQWSTGSTNPNLVVQPVGLQSFALTVMDNCGQTAITTFDVFGSQPSATISGTDAICQGNFNASLQIELTGIGPFDITYSIDDSYYETITGVYANNFDLPVSIPGTYELVAVSASGCPGQVSGSGEVTIDEVLVEATPSNVSCFGLTDGSIELEVEGGASPYSYNWNQGLPDEEDVSDLSAGTYIITVTDANGCSGTSSVVVEQPIPLELEVTELESLDCLNPDNGSIVVEVDGGEGNYSYQWNNGATTSAIDNLQAGTYELTVTDENSCQITTTAVIEDNVLYPEAIATVGDTLDCSTNTVTLDATNSSTGPDFSYEWTRPDGTTLSGPNALDLIADHPGDYQLLVTNNSNHCETSTSVAIIENVTPPVAIAGVDDTLTCAIPSLSLNGNNSSQGPLYGYHWTTTDGLITSGAESLSPQIEQGGTYILEVTNSQNNCKALDTVAIAENQTEPAIALNSPGIINCYHPSIEISSAGSDSGILFEYEWTTTDGQITSPPTEESITIDATGTYQLTINNLENGCSSTESVLINENFDPPVADAGPSQELDCITSSTVLDGSNSSTNGNFQYSWSSTDGNIPGDHSDINLTVDAPGTYTLNVLDLDNGCADSSSVMVLENSDAPAISAQVDGILNCFETEIMLDGTGSASGMNYTTEWTSQENHTIQNADQLQATVEMPGTYTLSITDQNTGCISSSSVTVAQDTLHPTAEAGPGFTLTCDAPTFTLNGNNSDQGDPFQLEWSGPDTAVQSEPDHPTPLIETEGWYYLSVTNTENGCSSQDSVQIMADQTYPVADAGPDLRLTCAFPELAISADASNSGPDYAIDWNTLEGTTEIPAGNLTPVMQAAGTFELVIVDLTNGCATQDTVVVEADQDIPHAMVSPTSVLNCIDTVLTLDASPSSQGSQYQYQWQTTNGHILQGANSLAPTIDEPGSYQLRVLNTDNQCLDSTSIAISQDIATPVADAGPDFTLTCNEPQFHLQGTNSSQGALFAYEWSSPDATILADNTELSPMVDEAGTYQLLVRNLGNGCVATDEVSIQIDQEYPVAAAGPDLTLNCLTPAVQIEANNSSSGQAYAFTWTTLNGNAIPAPNDLSPTIDSTGIFELAVTNTENGCISRDTVEVSENFQYPSADAGPVQTLTCVDTVLALHAELSSQGPEYTYAWTTTDGHILGNPNGLLPEVDAPGNYQLVITHQESFCQDTAEVEILQDIALPTADAGSPFTLTCTAPVLELDGTGSSQGDRFSYHWESDGGQSLSSTDILTPSISASGTYTLSVIDTENGCKTADNVTIDVDQEYPVVEAGPDAILNCAQTNFQIQANATNTGNNFDMQWNTLSGSLQIPSNTLSPTIDQSGTFELVVTNADNGCVTSDTVAISENFATPVADAGESATLTCTDTTLVLDGTGSSQGSVYAYTWSTNTGHFLSNTNEPSPAIDAPGMYTLVVSHNESFCRDTAAVSISQDIEPPVVSIALPDTLTCEVSTVSLDGNGSSSGITFIYSWTSEDGQIINEPNEITATADQPGQYALEVTNTENGCKTTSFTEVTENRIFPTADAGPDGRLTCAVQAVDLNGNQSSSGSQIIYQWASLEDQSIEGFDQTVATVSDPGQYILTVLDNVNQCASYDTVEVSIDTIAPIANAGLSDTLTCAVTQLALNGMGSSTGTDFTYQWSATAGQSINNPTSLQPQVTEAGTYQLLVSDADNGCTAEDMVEIAVDTLYPSLFVATPEVLTCTVTSFPLSASAEGNHLLSYQWTTSNGLILEDEDSLTPIVADAGTYELTATNQGNGCISSIFTEVAIDTIAPLANAGAAPELNCSINSIQLDGSASSQGNYAYQWTGPANAILNGGTSLFPAVTSPGVYTLLVENLENGCTQMDQVEVELNDEVPVGGIVPPAELNCETVSVTLEGYSDETTTPYDYYWQDEAGNILGFDSSLSIDVNEPGTYGLFITNLENNCQDSVFVNVNQDIAIPEAEAGELAVLTCIETTATLDGNQSSSGSSLVYEWSTDNGHIVSGANSLSPTVDEEGVYTLFIRNQDNGCTNEDQVEVIEEVPEAATITKADPLCYGDFGRLEISNVEGGFGPHIYSIDGGEHFSDQQQYSAVTPGVYDIVVQDINGCTYEEVVEIIEPIDLEITLEANVGIRLGDVYQLDARVNIPYSEIQSVNWTPATGLSCTDCLTPEASPTQTTNYEVKVVNNNGCEDVAKLYLSVDRRDPIYVPNAFSPYNGDDVNDRFVVYAKDDAIRQVNSLLIFNRWGEMVFQVYDFPPNDPQYGWNGLHRGEKMNPGVFVYWTEVELIDGTKVLLKGDVTLMD